MKNKIDGILLVEGKSDVNFLSSFLDALFFITDGYNINQRKLDFLLEASKVNKLIIMTDNDEAGEKIRDKIHNAIHAGYDVRINSNSRKNYKKHGVAEALKEEVLLGLKDFFTDKEIFDKNYDLATLISLDENPKRKREEIVQKFHLIGGNNKAIENQLRILKITKEELWK